MSKFKFEIRNPFIQKRIAFIGVLHFTAGVFLAAAAFQQLNIAQSKGFYYVIIVFGFLEIILTFFIRTIIKKIRWIHFTARFISILSFFILAFNYFLFMFPMLGMVLVLLSLSYLGTTYLEHQMIRPFIIKFNNGEIAIPAAFNNRYYEWQRIANIVLRHALLTINFKSNKMLQAELTEEPSAEEQEAFNQFCEERLSLVN